MQSVLNGERALKDILSGRYHDLLICYALHLVLTSCFNYPQHQREIIDFMFLLHFLQQNQHVSSLVDQYLDSDFDSFNSINFMLRDDFKQTFLYLLSQKKKNESSH
jgi:hypothetical protein